MERLFQIIPSKKCHKILSFTSVATIHTLFFFNTMNFLGIDPGNNWGWATHLHGEDGPYGAQKLDTLMGFAKSVERMIRDKKIDAIVTCRAMGRNQQVIRFHSAMAGIVELACEYMDKTYFDVADVTMRKVVIGKGNAKKPEVMSFLGIDNEHAADAMVGARYLAAVTI